MREKTMRIVMLFALPFAALLPGAPAVAGTQALEGTASEYTVSPSGRIATRTVAGKVVAVWSIDPASDFRFTEDFYHLVGGKFVRVNAEPAATCPAPIDATAAFNQGWNAYRDALPPKKP
jgi:hypothetical protein